MSASVALVTVAGLAVSGVPALAYSPQAWGEPKAYSLTLGDSLAFGFQHARIAADLAGGTYTPDHYSGYVVPLAQKIATAFGQTQTAVNYSCPGETTATMISGPCRFSTAVRATYPQYRDQRVLHDDYEGSQLGAAVKFLKAHRRNVAPITVSIGGNDVLALMEACSNDLACITAGMPAVIDNVKTNLSRILLSIRLASLNTRIIVLGLYNPEGPFVAGSDDLAAQLNGVIKAMAQYHGARFADGFTAVNLAIPGDEMASLCANTLMCTPAQDIHPSDSGYVRLANALWTASGYERLAWS